MTEPQATVDRLGLKIRAEFVPFSRSRNADKDPKRNIAKRSLNWRVTLVRQPAGGAQMHGAPLNASAPAREILTTDYSAGVGHCPSYKQGARWTLDYATLIEHETETGCTARPMNGINFISKGAPIEPKALDVLYSLVLDSSVLDASSFEDWATELGYDTDSRSAEATYRACLELALKLRAGLGDAAMAELREAFQDY